ncbi:hypothetical protein MG293_001044 [Ovis ammon polii]|uniref:Uncharacterized protein n=1 Tax=Ovis ammon polii TaxID=230172 RepID=A0AAD4UPK0_OVIAM|nr:hypothetical protein MG293_001044 [Ovis ammon polii]
MFKVGRGSDEEIPLVQGKEQWLRFAGAAVKRYPTFKVRSSFSSSFSDKPNELVPYKVSKRHSGERQFVKKQR